MDSTPQLTFNAPIFNTATLEGAVLHILQTCDNLSDVALDAFCREYAACRGKRLKSNYASTKLLPRLKAQRKVFQTGTHNWSLNPQVRGNWKARDAFWVFIEYLNSVNVLGDTMKGPFPAQISFVKDGKIYHIVRLEEDGQKEMAFLCQLEIEQMQRMKKGREGELSERFILIFSSEEEADNCPYQLKSPSLPVVIRYEEGQHRPRLKVLTTTKARA